MVNSIYFAQSVIGKAPGEGCSNRRYPPLTSERSSTGCCFAGKLAATNPPPTWGREGWIPPTYNQKWVGYFHGTGKFIYFSTLAATNPQQGVGRSITNSYKIIIYRLPAS